MLNMNIRYLMTEKRLQMQMRLIGSTRKMQGMLIQQKYVEKES